MDCAIAISLYLFRIFTFVLRQRRLLQSSASRRIQTASSPTIHSLPQGLWNMSLREAPTCACTCCAMVTPYEGWLWPVEAKDSKTPSFWPLLHLPSCYKWKREGRSTCRACSCHCNTMEEGNPGPLASQGPHNWNSFTVASPVSYWYQTPLISYFKTAPRL